MNSVTLDAISNDISSYLAFMQWCELNLKIELNWDVDRSETYSQWQQSPITLLSPSKNPPLDTGSREGPNFGSVLKFIIFCDLSSCPIFSKHWLWSRSVHITSCCHHPEMTRVVMCQFPGSVNRPLYFNKLRSHRVSQKPV